MYPNVHCSTVYNSQDNLNVYRQMNGYRCNIPLMYTHIVEYYSTIKKEIMTFTATWMDVEIIILHEISQRKMNII